MKSEIRLSKNSGNTEIKSYFQAVLELSQSGNEFPIDLDEVWGLAYPRKDHAVRALTENFMQDVDYQVFLKSGEKPYGGRPTNVYKLSVSCIEFFVARKVRPVFEVYRQVFHKVASSGFVLPQNFAQALRLAADQYEQIEEQNKQIEALNDEVIELKKKTDYLEVILQSKETVCISQIASDYGMTPQAMNNLLNKMRIQHKVNGQWLLYAEYLSKGYVHSETINVKHNNGRAEVKRFTRWRQSGRLFLYNKLKECCIIPLIER